MTTQDVRPDIAKDHRLWADVLALCDRLNKKYDELKMILGYLRRAECELWLENSKLCFRFNRDNLDDYLIQRAKEILKPYKAVLKAIFQRVAEKHAGLDPKDWKENTPF